MGVTVNGGGLHFDATLNADNYDRQFNQLIRNTVRGTDTMSANFLKQGNQINDLTAKITAAAAGFFSIQAATGFVQSLIKVRSEFQQLDIAFTTMLKSKEKADTLMQELITFAGTTPFGLKDAAQGAKQLLAYGSAAKDVVGELRMLGDVASGVSAPIGDLVYLYGTLKTQGRAYAMDIRQFAGRGIPIYAELAKVLRINKDEVAGFVEAGKVGFADVEQAFRNMTSTGGLFGNLMEKQSKTLTGQMERMKDAWELMLNDMGKSQEGMIGQSIASITYLIENYQKVLDVIGSLVAGYGAYRAALLVTAATTSVLTYSTAGFTAAEILHYYWTNALTKAQRLLNATMLANPYGAVAAALAAITTYLLLTEEATTKVKTATELTADAVRSQGDSVSTAESKLRVYLEMLKNTNLSETERISIYKKIKEIDPDIVKGIDAKTISYKNLKNGVDEYIRALREKFKLETQESALKASMQRENELKQNITDIGNETDIWSKIGLESPGHKKDRENRIKETRDALLKQQIETNKLIGNSVQQGTKQQIQAAENDLAIIESQKSLYKKGSVELITLQKQYLEKQQEITDLKSLKKPEEKPADQVAVTKNKAFYDSIVKENTEKLEALDKAAGDFSQKAAPLKKKITDAQRQLLSFSVAKPGATDRIEDSALKRHADMLNKIYELNEKYNTKSLTDDEQKLAEIRNEYKNLKKDIDAYNNDPKNKKVNTDLKPLLEKSLDEEAYRQGTKLLKTSLDTQKQLFSEFEQFKTDTSKDEAIKRFGVDLKGFQDYGQLLQSEIAKINQTAAIDLTGPQQERLKDLLTDLEAFNSEKKSKESKQYADAYAAALTYNQNVDKINTEYREKAVSLGASITDEQKSNLLKARDVAVEAAKDEALQKTDIYKKLAVETLELTRDQVKGQIEIMRGLLSDGSITGDLKAKLEAELGQLQFALKIGVDQANYDAMKRRIELLKQMLNAKDAEGSSIISTTETARILADLKAIESKVKEIDVTGNGKVDWADGLAKNFEYLKGTSKEIAEGIANDLGNLSGSFNELSQAMGGTDTAAGYTLDTIGQMTAVAADAAGAVASFASGDIIGGITKTVSAITGIFSISKKVKEMNEAARKEVADFYAQALAGEREYQGLLRQRERDAVKRGKNSYSAIIAELEFLKAKSPEIQAAYDKIFQSLQGQQFVDGQGYQHGTWFRKAKTWDVMGSLFGADYDKLESLDFQKKLTGQAKIDFDDLKKLREELTAAGVDVQELQNQLKSLLTGTSSSGLADGLIQLFENGKFAAEDFGKSFEDIMKNAILNSFKYKMLEDGMQPFFEEFSALFVNGTPTEADIALLRSKYLALGSEFAAKFKEWEKITGISFTDTNIVDIVIEVDTNLIEIQDQVFRLFESGTLTVEDFGNNVTDIIKQSILDGFKAEIFTEGLKAFSDKLKEFQKSGKPLNEAQIAELKLIYFSFVDQAKAKLEDLEKITGLTFAEIIKGEIGAAGPAIDEEFKALEDSIIGIFANAENAAEQFNDTFNALIEKSILNNLRKDILSEQVKAFYDEYKKLSETGDGLTEEKIAELRVQYDKIIKDAQAKLLDYTKITGVSFNPEPRQTELAGSISRAITEETGSALAGIWRAQYEETKRQGMSLTKILAVAQLTLEAVIRIEQNTFRTANNTDGVKDKLDAIVTNTRPVSNQTMRDLGLKI